MDKIAEIKEVVDDTKQMKGQQVVYLAVKDVEHLLSELERKDEELERFIDQAARELEAANRNWREKGEENRKLREELQTANDREQKLIEGLRTIYEEASWDDVEIRDIARNLLAEIGVTVDD